MKRTTFVSGVLFVVAAQSLSAQTSAIQVGVEAGAVISSIVQNAESGFKSRKSPYGGVSLVVQTPTSRIGFQTGLLLVPKGATSDFGEADATFALNYVEVPLLLRLGMPVQGSKIIPTLLLGGSVGIKTSCKLKAESGSQSDSVDCDDPTSQGDVDIRTVDLGVSGGVEVAIPVGTRFFLAPTARYTRGLRSIVAGDTEGQSPKNGAFQIGAMFRIRM